jgi:hypothetical protein
MWKSGFIHLGMLIKMELKSEFPTEKQGSTKEKERMRVKGAHI